MWGNGDGYEDLREGRRTTWASPLSRHQELTPFPQDGLEKQGQGSFWLIERPRELPTFLKCSTATIKQQTPKCLFKSTLPEIGSPKPSVPQSHLQKCTWSSLSHTGNPIAWVSVGKKWVNHHGQEQTQKDISPHTILSHHSPLSRPFGSGTEFFLSSSFFISVLNWMDFPVWCFVFVGEEQWVPFNGLSRLTT